MTRDVAFRKGAQPPGIRDIGLGSPAKGTTCKAAGCVGGCFSDRYREAQ
ncbi:MAG: hypothetical protein ACFFCW_10995 [Candidatus Hodarchaeota archaeon]